MNAADLQTFKSQGVVFVQQLLPPALVEHWRRQVSHAQLYQSKEQPFPLLLPTYGSHERVTG
jgi:hypothetical protein